MEKTLLKKMSKGEKLALLYIKIHYKSPVIKTVQRQINGREQNIQK
jgi:hypothetical protein